MREARIGRNETIAESQNQQKGVVHIDGSAGMNDTAKIAP
jgi:hypothetical protein